MANEIEVNKGRSSRTPSAFGETSEIQDLFERVFGRPSWFGEWPAAARTVSPTVEETEHGYCLEAEIPGIPKEDVEIDVNGNLLTIRAEHKSETGEKSGRRGFSRSYRKIQQSFALPTSVDADGIEANYENGVLQVFLPKSTESKSKRIDVQSGKRGFLDRLYGKGDGEVDAGDRAKH